MLARRARERRDGTGVRATPRAARVGLLRSRAALSAEDEEARNARGNCPRSHASHTLTPHRRLTSWQKHFDTPQHPQFSSQLALRVPEHALDAVRVGLKAQRLVEIDDAAVCEERDVADVSPQQRAHSVLHQRLA